MASSALQLKQACQDLVGLLDKGEATLDHVARKLESEFADRFSTGVNPMALAKRIRQLERDLPVLKQQCQSVLSSKQELVDSAKRVLDANHRQLHQLCSKSGCQAPDDTAEHEGFTRALSEWDSQMRAHAGHMAAGNQAYSTHGLNQALAKSNLEF